MKFPVDLKFPAENPIRICVGGELEILNRIYSGRFPTVPVGRSSLSRVGIEFVRDVYSQVLRPIALEEAAASITYCSLIGRDKFSDDIFVRDEDTVWGSWFVVFDHLVPDEEEGPEAAQLDISDVGKVTHRDRKSDRARINSYVHYGRKLYEESGLDPHATSRNSRSGPKTTKDLQVKL